jgi:hypothetical protein
MIRIGLNTEEKKQVINEYIKQNPGLKLIVIFTCEKFPADLYDGPIETERYGYKDIIEYKPFYHLLEVIDDDCLLVFDECMRTQNRSDLTYNCAHHYCNQTSRKIVFEHFPFIEDYNDFMILLDLINKGKYKGKSFRDYFLIDEDIRIKQHHFAVNTIDIPVSELDRKRYEKKKESLFASLGNRDPDTIPRNLHIFTGDLKKPFIEPNKSYVARNSRFNLPNVITYKDVEQKDYIIIDFPHRRLDFNDFLKRTGMHDIIFLNSTLKVDLYYLNELRAWVERLGEFYAKASIY